MTRTVFTTISPVPPGISREVVLDFLHNHVELIDLNPLVKERHPIDPPPQYRHDEDEKDGVWYSITDHIDYLPGGRVSGDVSYTCRFRDLPNGIQTHCRAGLGVDIRETWTLCGALPGEPRAPAAELGALAAGAPSSGLYLREDCDLRCNLLMTGFVKKNLKKAHAVLVQRLVEKSRVMSSSSSSSSRKAGGGGRRRGEEDDDEDDEDDAPSLASISSYYMSLPLGLGTTAAEPTPSSSSLSPPPPSSNDAVRPASYSGYPFGDAGRTSSPPLFGMNNTSVVGGHRPTGLDPFPAVQDEQQQHHQHNSRGRASTESSSYRLYSQYDNIPSQPPAPGVLFPLALRVPAGPTPPAAVAPYAVLVERHENNNHNYNYNNNNSYNSYAPPQRPPTRVDPELCPTPLRIRGLSAGSSTSAGAATVTSPPTTMTRAHASSVSSHHSTTGSSSGTTTHHHTSSFGKSRASAGTMPRAPPSLSLGGAPRIIAPPEQHPEYPMLSPYHYEYYPAPPGGEGGRRSSSSYGSSPADDDDDEDDYTRQPETPQFFSPDELVVVGDARSRVGEEEEVKHGRQRVVVEAEHPAVLRPGFGGGGARVLSSSSSNKSSSGLFLAELE